MDHYHIWVDLKETHRDLEFAAALGAFLGRLEREGHIAGYRLARRKLGFGPAELGEFHVDIEVRDLNKLDAAFHRVAPRTGEVEGEHARVWSMVRNFRAGLWRDFPDAERASGAERAARGAETEGQA